MCPLHLHTTAALTELASGYRVLFTRTGLLFNVSGRVADAASPPLVMRGEGCGTVAAAADACVRVLCR